MRPSSAAVLLFSSVAVALCQHGYSARPSVLADNAYLLDGPSPLNWTCDTPAGKYNQIHAAIESGSIAVTGTLHLMAMIPGPNYGSGTMVGFLQSEDREVGRSSIAR